MTRGAGRTTGHRGQDSELRAGRLVAVGSDRSKCPQCRMHVHGSCWAYLEEIGVAPPGPEWADDQRPPTCLCGCHFPADAPSLTDAALEDMAVHGTLVQHVRRQQQWWFSSGPLHFKDPCRRCSDKQTLAGPQQETLL